MKSGIIGATILITSTTIDDAIWLVPYCTSSHLPTSTKIIHALTFVCTLELLSVACIGFYYLMKHGLMAFVNGDGDDEYYDDHGIGKGEGEGGEGGSNSYSVEGNDSMDGKIGFFMECIGAFICWSIAIFLYIKKMMKRRRKRLENERKQKEEDEVKTFHQPLKQHDTLSNTVVHDEEVNLEEQTEMNNNINYQENNSFNKEEVVIVQDNDHNDDINTIPTTPSMPIIISLTTLGALDEISYFPALIMGKIFMPLELCIGAFFASLIILIVITLFLAQCKPLVDWLDRIPLYGIVGMFAVVLTLGLFF